MADDDEAREIFGDPFGSLHDDLANAIMDAIRRLPASLDAALEGREGPVEIPAEQWAEAQRHTLDALMTAMQNVARALDVARGRITKIEKRLAEIDGGRSSNPDP